MKRLISVLTLILCLAVYGEITSCAKMFKVSYDKGYVMYNTISDVAAEIAGCKGVGSISVPPEITLGRISYVVVGVADDAFNDNQSLGAIHLPEGIKYIGARAFKNCDNLFSVTIPSSVVEIRESAFERCGNLNKAEILAGRLDVNVFGACNSLETVVLPDGIVEIPGWCFTDCGSLKKIQLPRTVKVIKEYAFSNSGLERMEFHVGIKEIGDYAFYGCGCLTEVVLPTGQLGQHTFDMCKLLRRVVLPNALTEIPSDCFSYCDNLTSIELPPSIKEIKNQAFSHSGIRQINFPVGLEKIGEFAFKDCQLDLRIPLPRTTLFIAKDSFEYGISSQWIGIDRRFDYTTLPDYVTMENCEHYGVEKEDFLNYRARKNAMMLPQNNIYADGQAQPSNYVMPSSPLPAVPMSDVDKDIFKTSRKSADTYAVVIANEQYSQCVDVEFAGNDGEIMCQYLENTLGIPKKQISYYKNASYATMESALSRLEKLSAVLDGDMNVVFYYAGHGIPDEKSHEAYLVPCDVDGKDTRFCMHTGQMYKRLAALNTRQVVVLMDACFSGSTRGDQMINPVRGVAIAPKESAISGKMVVLTAASADESALPSSENGHGMFTYHLLKKLQQSHGEATLGEIADYVIKNVRRESLLDKNKLQSPTIKTSLPREVWGTWTL